MKQLPEDAETLHVSGGNYGDYDGDCGSSDNGKVFTADDIERK